jgi:apolipoprotein N-acyltransferase
MLAALRNASFVRIWFSLWVCHGVYSILAMWWLRQTGSGVGWMLAVLPIYFAIPMLLPAAGLALAPAGPLRLLAFPFLWGAFEILARLIFLRLNWAIVGLPLADYPVLSQVASLAGPESLSFLAAAASVLLVLLVTLRGKQRGFAAAAGLVLTAAVVGFGLARSTGSTSGLRTLKLALVQPDIPQEVIWTPQNREPFLGRITDLINRTIADAPDVIVLPEGTVNGLVRYDPRLTDFVRSTVIRMRTPLLFGSFDRQGDAFFNAAFYIDPFNTVATYHKIRLAPFVEYEPAFLPFHRPSNWLRFTAGTEHTVFSTKGGQRFSTMICLEDSMPEVARDFARSGAQLLVGLVNTQQYLGTSEPLQHLRRARLTAIAVGLPMARCANSGVSCLINPLGQVEKMLDEGRPEAAVVNAPLLSLDTMYRRTGDWPWFTGMLLAGYAIALLSRVAGDKIASAT